jgi:hypothetical protein
LPTFFADHQT